MRIEEPKTMKIQAADVISGSLYLKLIADYQEYDKRQKEYISSLESRISDLTQVFEETRSGNKKTILEKLELKNKKIRELRETIKKLETENGELLHKLTLQNLKIKQ